MTIEIRLPGLSPSMTAGRIGRWLKAPGDWVETGDALVEVETDKATMELEAADAGILGAILVAEGTDDVPIDTPIATLLSAAEAKAQSGAAAPLAAPAGAAPARPGSLTPANRAGRVFASPLARRLAEREGLELAAIAGSGPRGRVVRVDIDAIRAAAAPVASVPDLPEPAPIPREPEAGDVDAIPNSPTRKVIAERLGQSKRDIPHYYLTVDCDLAAVLDLRATLNARAPDGPDAYRLSVNDFVLRAVALALRDCPGVNASWSDAAIRRYRSVDVSVAVSTPNGLITPVIRQADGKGLAAISNQVKALARKARDGRLRPDEYQGGGFTVSNLGMYGIREFAGIINPPQAALLAVGRAEERAVARNGELAVATMMTCTLSADHRVIDGAEGAQFLKAFKRFIEAPLDMLL